MAHEYDGELPGQHRHHGHGDHNNMPDYDRRDHQVELKERNVDRGGDERRGEGRRMEERRGRDERFDGDREGRRRRSPSRSPSPIPDFGNVSNRWSGWDKPVSRFGPVRPRPGDDQFGGPQHHSNAYGQMNQPGGHQMNYQAGMMNPSQNRTQSQGPDQHKALLQQRQQKRLYVGNLPTPVNELHLIDFLNASMAKVPGIVQGEGVPVIGIDMSNERTYAFVEMRSADEATFLTAFDGITYEGHSLRIHRPREWVPTGNEPRLPEIPPSALGIVSTTVPDGPNKIFIGGLPPNFNEADVKQILTAIGPLKAFNLVRDTNGNSKGFAFCEYVDPELTDIVCQSFNGRKHGDKVLVVQRSQPGAKTAFSANKEDKQPQQESQPQPSGQLPPDAIITGPDNLPVLAPESEGGISIFNGALNTSVPTDVLTNTVMTMAKQQTHLLEPTPILVLLNAVDTTEEWTDDYYNSVCGDMYQEGSKYGTIVNMVIPRAPPKPKKRRMLVMPGELSESDIGAEAQKDQAQELPPPPGYGRVFIQYQNAEQSKAALQGMVGRKYDGRMLLGSFTGSLPS